MKMSKRILAMLLAVLMVASVAPMSVMQAAAENITEAVSDLGDALAVNSAEEPAETPEDAAPAEEPEQNEEEPAAAEPAASESEETEAALSEEPASEELASEEPASVEPASEDDASTEPAEAEEASSSVETTAAEATTEAVKKAARRAPLAAGPELDLGLNGYNNGLGRFEFNSDGTFRILQLSDIQTQEGSMHDGVYERTNGINRATINTIQNAIRFYKPDLIVMTGDQICTLTMPRANFQHVANHYRDIIIGADPNVKFALVFGNHDPASTIDGVTGEASTQIQYECYKTAFGGNFVDYDVSSLAGTGNGKIDIYAGNSVAAQAFLFDSQQSCIGASNGEDSGSANRAIVNWYNSNATVPNVVFQHIILNEVMLYGTDGSPLAAGQSNGLIAGVSSGGVGGSYGTSNLALASGASGELNETPCPYGAGINRYATKQQFLGMANHNCMVAFFGHDHVNSFGGPVTVYGKTVNFYACPGMTSEEYYGGQVPGVRTITLTRSGSSVNMNTQVYGMDEMEVQSASSRVSQNEVGALNGGIPAIGTVAVPAVLYQGAAANNSDPVQNQSFGTILQKYIYNYQTMHIDAANTAVRFALPPNATFNSITAKVSTATGTTVNMNGSTSISLGSPSTEAIDGGATLYTWKLAEGANLGSGAKDVVYTVTYTQGGVQKTVYAVSCVEDIKIPAGYSVWKTSGASEAWTIINSKYMFAVSGDNVYGAAQSTNTVSYDSYFMGYSNGWQRLFTYQNGNFNAQKSGDTYGANYGQYQLGGTDSRYALAYNGSNYGEDGDNTTITYKTEAGSTTNFFPSGLRPNNPGQTRPPKADIYVDTGKYKVASNGQFYYGAKLSFVNTHIAADVFSSENVRDYPTYVAGIGFQNRSGDASFDYGALLGNGNDNSVFNNGYWRDWGNFQATLKTAIETEQAADNMAANTQVAGYYAANQSLSHVTTTHTNGNMTAANEIPNGGLLSYELTSDGTMVADGTRLSMIVGGRVAQRSDGINYIMHTLQAIDLNFHTYDKAALRKLVENEMQQARSGSGTVYTTWRQALANAQAILVDAKTNQTEIDAAASALTTAKNAVVQEELGITVGDPSTPANEPGQLITKIDVPPTLYSDPSGNIYTATTNADGFAKTNDKYATAISVTAAAGVSNVKLYLTDASDSTGTQISLSQSGQTWSGSFPSGKSCQIDSDKTFGKIYYRLEYDYTNGKHYTAYAASCVKVKYHTASAWINQNGQHLHHTKDGCKDSDYDCYAQIDSRMIVDVSELLGKKGVSAVTALYSADAIANQNSEVGNLGSLSTYSQSDNPFSTEAYGPSKFTPWSYQNSDRPKNSWVWGGTDGGTGSSGWMYYSAIDYYFNTSGTANQGRFDTNTNSDYAGMSVFINRGTTNGNGPDFTGLYGSHPDSEIASLGGSKAYVMAHVSLRVPLQQ